MDLSNNAVGYITTTFPNDLWLITTTRSTHHVSISQKSLNKTKTKEELLTLAFAIVGEGLDEKSSCIDGVDVAADPVVLRLQWTDQTTVISVGTRVGPANTCKDQTKQKNEYKNERPRWKS